MKKSSYGTGLISAANVSIESSLCRVAKFRPNFNSQHDSSTSILAQTRQASKPMTGFPNPSYHKTQLSAARRRSAALAALAPPALCLFGRQRPVHRTKCRVILRSSRMAEDGGAPISRLDGRAPDGKDFANYFCTYAFLYHQVDALDALSLQQALGHCNPCSTHP
jgi:hypothetical protein